MKKIKAADLYTFFEAVASKKPLYIPSKSRDGQTRFELYENGKTLSDARNTVRSAKDFFFPQTENLVDFKIKDKNIEIIDVRSEIEDFVLFGVRACDARSFDVLDKVFLIDPVDSYYKNRRNNCTVITLACNKPGETCFCKTFGIDAAAPEGDITTWNIDDCFYMKANTQKGETFMSEYSDFFEDANENTVSAEQKRIHEVYAKLPFAALETKSFDDCDMMQTFKSDAWKKLSESCIGCGTCTFVCPTCQCYDIKDFDTGHGIKRFRCWDSCMYKDFTQMSAGQPRLTQLERFRQRFMHKLVYFPENNKGMYGCVGCGRCVAKCPIHMNIVKVIKTVGKGMAQ